MARLMKDVPTNNNRNLHGLSFHFKKNRMKPGKTIDLIPQFYNVVEPYVSNNIVAYFPNI